MSTTPPPPEHTLWLPFSNIKNSTQNGRQKFLFTPSEYRLFCEMEYARNSVADDKKAWNSVPNHFAEEKNIGNLFRTILRKVKMLRILLQTISQKRKTLGISF
jgi:hypothetical protein